MNIRVFFYDGVDYSTGEMLAASVAFSENYIEFIGYELLPTDKCSIIMRGTGLKDKNGIEIYEGDLISDPYPIDDEDLSKGYHESSVPVAWCSEKLQWCIDASYAKDGSFLTSLTEYFGDELEVIGNIYEQQTKKSECDCQDFDKGLISNYCKIHNENPYKELP